MVANAMMMMTTAEPAAAAVTTNGKPQITSRIRFRAKKIHISKKRQEPRPFAYSLVNSVSVCHYKKSFTSLPVHIHIIAG